MRVRFTQSARKHRIGHTHVLHVMNTIEPVVIAATDDRAERRTWIGNDDRELELEIVAVVLPDLILVIHAMPTALRRQR